MNNPVKMDKQLASVLLLIGIVSIFEMEVESQFSSTFGDGLGQSGSLNVMMQIYNGLLNQSNSDILFIVDTSSGIKKKTFHEMKQVSLGALKCFSLLRQSRVGLLTFADSVQKRHLFNQCQTETCIANSIRSLRLTGGKRAIGMAMREAKRLFKKQKRRGVRRVIVMVTYGPPTKGKKAHIIATRLKKFGVDMYVIGVGRQAVRRKQSLMTISRPFTPSRKQQRLFIFREPKNDGDYRIIKTVVDLVCSKESRLGRLG